MKHLEIVVGFEDQGVRGADAFDDEPGGVAEVGEEPDVSGGSPQKEADGVLGVVRNAEGVDGNVVQLECGSGGKKTVVERGIELCGDGLAGETIAVDGDSELARQDAETLGVVGVFVSDENAR